MKLTLEAMLMGESYSPLFVLRIYTSDIRAHASGTWASRHLLNTRFSTTGIN